MSGTHSLSPLLKWLSEQFSGDEHTPPWRSQRELAYVAGRLVRLYLEKPQPLRRSAVAKKLATLSRNLERAAKAATELGDQGMSYVLVASDSNGMPETSDSLNLIGNLQDVARWSTKAAETAKLMSLSDGDHKGGRTPDQRLRSLVTILMDRYELLLGIKASHVADPSNGLGHSLFDRFVKEAIRLHAPESLFFESYKIDDAIRRALPSRASNFWSG